MKHLRAIKHLKCLPRENNLLVCLFWYVKEKRLVGHVVLPFVPLRIEVKVSDAFAIFKLERQPPRNLLYCRCS